MRERLRSPSFSLRGMIPPESGRPLMSNFLARMNVVLLISVLVAAATANARQLSAGEYVCDSIPYLKRAYLECERLAQSGRLSTGGIAHCSTVYYDLKDRAFDGDFNKIRSWYEMSASLQGREMAMPEAPRETRPCGWLHAD